MRMVIDMDDKKEILPGQFIKSHRGEVFEFRYASRMAIPGKSGKILAIPVAVPARPDPHSGEYYDHAFRLLVIDTDYRDDSQLCDYWDTFGINSHAIMAEREAIEKNYHYN